VAGGRDVREDPGQVALPVPWRRPGWPGARLLVVANPRPGSGHRVLPTHDQFDGCIPEHVVTDKATFYPSAIRTCAPGARHTATGFYNLVISTNRCERNHSYVKSRLRPMRGLKSFDCATRLFPALDALQLVERDSCGCRRTRAGAAGRDAVHRRTQLCPSAPPRNHHSAGPVLVGLVIRGRTPSEHGPVARTQTNIGEPEKAHKPHYIAPYVKGPEDKPLKPPASQLFVVKR